MKITAGDTWTMQAVLNKLGITDNSGQPLKVDGDWGRKTEEAKQKAKHILQMILS